MQAKRQFNYVSAQFTIDEWTMMMTIFRKVMQEMTAGQMEVNQEELDFIAGFFLQQ